jgi:hypothetical protein
MMALLRLAAATTPTAAATTAAATPPTTVVSAVTSISREAEIRQLANGTSRRNIGLGSHGHILCRGLSFFFQG